MSYHPIVERALTARGINDLLAADPTAASQVHTLHQIVTLLEEEDSKLVETIDGVVSMAMPTREQIAARAHLTRVVSHVVATTTRPVRIDLNDDAVRRITQPTSTIEGDPS